MSFHQSSDNRIAIQAKIQPLTIAMEHCESVFSKSPWGRLLRRVYDQYDHLVHTDIVVRGIEAGVADSRSTACDYTSLDGNGRELD